VRNSLVLLSIEPPGTQISRSSEFSVVNSTEMTLNTGWHIKNVPNFRTTLCNRVVKINEVKSTYSVSKHLRIIAKIFTYSTSVLAVIQTKLCYVT